MGRQDLIQLHDSFKHDVNEFTFDKMFANRQWAKDHHDSNYDIGYSVGYEQAIIDIQNWLMSYRNIILDTKKG